YWITQFDTLPIKQRSEIDVSGNDLMDWFDKKGGPWLNETLLTIENKILARELENDKQKIKEWLMKCNQK
ncbi:MAG: CCA tRNA nucleotidyltransferase, partial [Bacillus sp. (in: firmicutes)]